MDLWIRSQDKKQLLKVNDGLYIANGFVDETDSFIGIKNLGHIGRYKTEKRALEVLKDIQIYINNGCKQFVDIGIYHTPIYEYSVYEMPKE